MPNAWENRLYKPKYPKLTVDSYTRENDVTFSFGRETSHAEVLNLLTRSGCFKAEDYLNEIKMLRITRALRNGQVFLQLQMKVLLTTGQRRSTGLLARTFLSVIHTQIRRFWYISTSVIRVSM